METLQPLINESIQLLLIGMGTVFLILIMLIFLITLVSKLIPEEDVNTIAVSSQPTLPQTSQSNATNDAQLVAVISAAIAKFKKKHST